MPRYPKLVLGPEDRITLGQNIREAREHSSITNSQLYRVIGVSETLLSLIESGDREPTVAVLLRISRELRTSLSDLTRGVEE